MPHREGGYHQEEIVEWLANERVLKQANSELLVLIVADQNSGNMIFYNAYKAFRRDLLLFCQ